MKKDSKDKSGESLKKRYAALIKKTSTEDLRDMLTILYSEPTLAINNPDFYNLEKKEKEFYAKDRARIAFTGEGKREDLISRLDKDFRIFDKESISNPLWEEAPDGLKSLLEKITYTFPKASLLITLIKATLTLRESGKELSADEKISLIE